MNTILLAVILAYILVSAFRGWLDLLNLWHAQKGGIPPELRGSVDEAKAAESIRYLAAQTRYGLVHRAINTFVVVVFLAGGGFAWVDRLAALYTTPFSVAHSLLYFLVLMALDQIVEIPFSLYHTFVLEQKFGFNRSTWKVFVGDLLKGWALGLVLGGLIAGGIVWFFLHGGTYAWFWAWSAFTVLQLVLTFLAPVLFLPLFNKFEPLPAGELRSSIESFSQSVNFHLQGIFTMDASKRSSKSNAFFIGFGKFRRIVLFDTLVEKHSVPELVGVLAHEVGHYKKKHIPQQMFLSLLSSLVMFWIFSLLLQSEHLAGIFGFLGASVHAAFTMAFWLYSPFSLLSSLGTHSLSRKFEYEADAYARATTKNPKAMAAALQRLSVENLSNLNPHPWKVLFDYSHPPVALRIRELLR